MKKLKIPCVWPEPAPDIVRRTLGVEAEKLFHCYTLTGDAEEWKKQRSALHEKFARAMNLHADHSLPLDYREYGEVRCDGYAVRRVTYTAAPGRTVTGNLYVPDGKGPFPAVIRTHGHWKDGRLAAGVQRCCHFLVRTGFVVLAVDTFGAGERSIRHMTFEYHGSVLGGTLLNTGYPLLGIQVTDNMRGVDLLCSLPFVDPERIGATGESGGGNQTMWLTAMDDRIKAGVPVVSVGSFCSYVTNENCICEVLPDGLTFSEEAGLLALAAPRAFNLCNAMSDSCPSFAVNEMMRTFNNARKVYHALGAEDNLIMTPCTGPHAYSETAERSMMGFFRKHLLGIGEGRPCDTPDRETLPSEAVAVFEEGKRPADFMTIPAFCRREGEALKQRLFAEKTISRMEKTDSFRRILRLEKTESLFDRAYYNGPDGFWSLYTVRGTDGAILPVLVRKPRNGKTSCTAVASARGKISMDHSEMLKSLLDSDDGVILFDLSGSGEMKGDLRPEAQDSLAAFHNLARGLLWMGQRLLGLWTRDFLLMKEFARKELGAESVSFAGAYDGGICALFASLYTDCTKVVTENMPVTFQMCEAERPTVKGVTMAMVLPDVLTVGDVSLIAALSGAETDFRNMIHSNGEPLTAEENTAFLSEIEELKSRIA